MHRSVVIAAAAALAVASAAAAAQPSPLTLAEAQRRAVERSRALGAQDAAIAASREMAVAAGELPDPVLKLQLQNVPVEGPDRFTLNRDFMTMRAVGVMQEWTRREKRDLKRERFEREAQKDEAQKSVDIANIQRDTALAWLDTFYAQAMVGVITEQAAASQLEIAAAEGAYRAGRVNQADVIAAHSARTGLDDRVSEFARKLRNARTALARWVGAGADAPLAERPAIDRVHLHLDDGLEHQLSQHPDIEVLRRKEEMARTEARLAQANRKPDWSVEVMYSNRASQFGDMASIGVSVPLQLFQKDRQDREVAAKLAEVEKMRAEREEMERSHVAEVRNMVSEWQNGLERLKRYERELVPLARERTRATLSAYQGGKAASGDLLMARRNEIEVQMQALQLEMDTARLWAQLEYLAPDERVLPASLFNTSNAKVSP
ncbi:MAG: TolC family protein [Betaproteobacteria bacterium]